LLFPPNSPEESIMDIALEAGAEDVIQQEDGSIEVITSSEQFERVKEKMHENQLVPAEAEVTFLASTYVTLNEEDAEKMVKLQNLLEELDDVQNVYSNADIAAEILEKL
jgi:transcriptional/translational regulatory protein YebC/TACO1